MLNMRIRIYVYHQYYELSDTSFQPLPITGKKVSASGDVNTFVISILSANSNDCLYISPPQ
jgi:hypothetical protein